MIGCWENEITKTKERFILFKNKTGSTLSIITRTDEQGKIRVLKSSIRYIPIEALELMEGMAAVHNAETEAMREEIRKKEEGAALHEEQESQSRKRKTSGTGANQTAKTPRAERTTASTTSEGRTASGRRMSARASTPM